VREFGEVAGVRSALRGARPALLLTDVRMPDEDGLSLLLDLQAQAIGPVIVMSAYTDVATTAAYDEASRTVSVRYAAMSGGYGSSAKFVHMKDLYAGNATPL